MAEISIPSPDAEYGPPFVVGDHLTIWQAACIYVDQHPGDERFDDAASTARESVERRERRLGARPEVEGSPPGRDDDNAELALGAIKEALAARDHDKSEVEPRDYLVDARAQREMRRTQQAVYRELARAVAAGEITGAVPFYCEGGCIDTSRATVPIAALADLARRRGDAGACLSSMAAAAKHARHPRHDDNDLLARARELRPTVRSDRAAARTVVAALDPAEVKAKAASPEALVDRIRRRMRGGTGAG